MISLLKTLVLFPLLVAAFFTFLVSAAIAIPAGLVAAFCWGFSLAAYKDLNKD